MNKIDFERYNEVCTTISNKHAEYKESVKDLEAELVKKQNEYKESVKDLTEEKNQMYEQIKKTGKDLLFQAFCVLDKIIGYRFGTGWKTGEKELGLIFTKFKDSEYELSPKCKIRSIANITEDYVVFNADEDLGDGDYADGTVGIPIKYFTSNLLYDKNYINEVTERTKQRIAKEKKEKERQDKIAEIAALKARLAELEETNTRYAFIFDCNGSWMIVYYENNSEYKYFNSAEDDWDNALYYVDTFLENGGNKYYYKVPSYDYVEDIDIFELPNEPIASLSEFLINKE
jgi:hypothetical protein